MVHTRTPKQTLFIAFIAGLAAMPLAACNGSSASDASGNGAPNAPVGSPAAGNAASQGGMDNNTAGYNQGTPN